MSHIRTFFVVSIMIGYVIAWHEARATTFDFTEFLNAISSTSFIIPMPRVVQEGGASTTPIMPPPGTSINEVYKKISGTSAVQESIERVNEKVKKEAGIDLIKFFEWIKNIIVAIFNILLNFIRQVAPAAPPA